MSKLEKAVKISSLRGQDLSLAMARLMRQTEPEWSNRTAQELADDLVPYYLACLASLGRQGNPSHGEIDDTIHLFFNAAYDAGVISWGEIKARVKVELIHLPDHKHLKLWIDNEPQLGTEEQPANEKIMLEAQTDRSPGGQDA